MSVWYCGSVQYAAVSVWSTGVKAAGAFCRQVSPTDGNARVFRTTSGGTSSGSEPAWNLNKGVTTTDSGGVVWTEVTGNSLYGWSAPHKRLQNATSTSWVAQGDTIYVASNHAYSFAGVITIGNVVNKTNGINIVSVNASGSVPPVSGDLLAGATETTTGNSGLDLNGTSYVYGLTLVSGSGASGTANIRLGPSNWGILNFDTCTFNIATTDAGSRLIANDGGDTNAPETIRWKNCALKFGATAQGITSNQTRLTWDGGSVDGTGSIPVSLFLPSGSTGGSQTLLKGVDLSALGITAIVAANTAADTWQFVNCILPTGYVLTATPATLRGPIVDMVISDSASANYKHERHVGEGDLITEIVDVRSGGANDGVTAFSWKVTTSANAVFGHPFECFPRAVWNDTVGSSVTLTIELLNGSATLKDNDVWVDVEYLGSAGSPKASFATSGSNILAGGANLTTSSATWTTTGIGSPVKQKMSVSFTPQLAGYIRYTIRVAKASQVLWVDPKAALS